MEVALGALFMRDGVLVVFAGPQLASSPDAQLLGELDLGEFRAGKTGVFEVRKVQRRIGSGGTFGVNLLQSSGGRGTGDPYGRTYSAWARCGEGRQRILWARE